MEKNKIIILKNGIDVFGKKIEILINGEIIEFKALKWSLKDTFYIIFVILFVIFYIFLFYF